MDKELLAEKISLGLTLAQLAKEFGKSKTTVAYWIKQHGLKLKRGARGKYPPDFVVPRKCGSCGETNPKKFYGHKRHCCTKCHNKYNRAKGKEKRKYILDKLGNKCSVPDCGYNKYKSALDVHHLNPTIKDVSFRTHRYWSYEKIDKEIANCVLLCRNCHQAHHSGELDL